MTQEGTITQQVEIKLSTDQIAEALFSLDNKQVADVISKWVTLFDESYERAREAGEPVYIFDLNHFMLYVVKEMDEKGLDFIRSSYGTLVYTFCNDIHKKHLTKYK